VDKEVAGRLGLNSEFENAPAYAPVDEKRGGECEGGGVSRYIDMDDEDLSEGGGVEGEALPNLYAREEVEVCGTDRETWGEGGGGGHALGGRGGGGHALEGGQGGVLEGRGGRLGEEKATRLLQGTGKEGMGGGQEGGESRWRLENRDVVMLKVSSEEEGRGGGVTLLGGGGEKRLVYDESRRESETSLAEGDVVSWHVGDGHELDVIERYLVYLIYWYKSTNADT
jgi:hypothetical protein